MTAALIIVFAICVFWFVMLIEYGRNPDGRTSWLSPKSRTIRRVNMALLAAGAVVSGLAICFRMGVAS